MSTILHAVFFVAVFSALSVAGLLLVRKFVSPAVLRECHEVAAVFIGILGTIYSVLLAFGVFVVWTQFGDAQAAVSREATQLSILLDISTTLPRPIQGEIRKGVKEYCEAAEQFEWPAMQKGESSPELDKAVAFLWKAVLGFKPKNNDEELLKDKLMEQARSVGECRSLRIFHSHDQLPGMIWVILWVGGVSTVAFSYFFYLRNAWSQAILTAGLSGAIALMIFTIWAINQPFTGDIIVTPEPLGFLLTRFHL